MQAHKGYIAAVMAQSPEREFFREIFAPWGVGKKTKVMVANVSPTMLARYIVAATRRYASGAPPVSPRVACLAACPLVAGSYSADEFPVKGLEFVETAARQVRPLMEPVSRMMRTLRQPLTEMKIAVDTTDLRVLFYGWGRVEDEYFCISVGRDTGRNRGEVHVTLMGTDKNPRLTQSVFVPAVGDDLPRLDNARMLRLHVAMTSVEM